MNEIKVILILLSIFNIALKPNFSQIYHLLTLAQQRFPYVNIT